MTEAAEHRLNPLDRVRRPNPVRSGGPEHTTRMNCDEGQKKSILVVRAEISPRTTAASSTEHVLPRPPRQRIADSPPTSPRQPFPRQQSADNLKLVSVMGSDELPAPAPIAADPPKALA